MQNSNHSNSDNSHDESINIRELVEKYLFHWKWFVLSFFISLVVAFLYLRFTPIEYLISTTILIEDEKEGGLVSELSVFEDLGILEGQTSIDNEIELLKSRTLMERVIKNLGVNVTYYQKGRIKVSEIYGGEVPIKINFFNKDSIFNEQDTTFIIQIKSATTFSLKNSEGEKKGDYNFGQGIKTKFGDITITPSNFEKPFKGSEVVVKIKPLNEVIEYYRNQIQILPLNKKASVINISLKDRKKLKAETIVNNLVNQYNEDAVSFKTLIRKKTNSFIEERLEIIKEELLVVEQGAEAFKTENKLTNIDSEADLVLESKSDIKKNIIDLTTQLKLVEYISDYLKQNTNDLIPANLGLSEGGLDQSTQKYNELLSERNRILRSSNELNPTILNLNNQISSVRESIVQGLKNMESSLTISINQIQREDYRLSSKMAAAPGQEREYRNIQRQQEIIEALYLYLLEKREENAITLAVTLPNAKIIDRAYGKNIPVGPKPIIIYLIALFAGLVFAFLTIYIKLLLNNNVHNSKEVEALIKAPLLGEIPKTKGKQKVVINTKDRSGIAESFRMLRTNLDIILSSSKKGAKTIFITSTISNEGKTFISVNLASVIALLNKKVLLIEADLRKPKLEEYLDIKMDNGLAHFLSDSSLKVQDIISHIDTYNIDVLHSGISAPNPSELLSNGRFEEILDYGKHQYDYIIVDTPPVNLVTDTFLLGKNADLFLYIIRANYLDKRMLEIPAKLYEEKRLPNMAMVLNGSDFEKGYGYGKRINKKPWWKK